MQQNVNCFRAVFCVFILSKAKAGTPGLLPEPYRLLYLLKLFSVDELVDPTRRIRNVIGDD